MTDKVEVDSPVNSKTKARRKYESTGRGKTIIKVNLASNDDPKEWEDLKDHLTEEYGSVKAGIMAMYKGQNQADVTPHLHANRMLNFLICHADMKADFDPEHDDECDMWASPDAGNLYMIAGLLIEHGELPKGTLVDSSWESGGYRPYSDKEARDKHDRLVAKAKEWLVK